MSFWSRIPRQMRFVAVVLVYRLLLRLTSANAQQQIHVTNVAKDVERWQRIRHELRHDVDKVQRLEAVNGRALSPQALRENASLSARLFCTVGTIGCYMSHRAFWEQALASDEPYQIVLEDDVVLAKDFQENFYETIQKRVEELSQAVGAQEWDVLLLGGLGCVNPNGGYGPYHIPAFMSGGRRKPQLISEHIHIPMRPYGTHAYVLSKRGAEKLLRLAYKATYHVDCVIWGIKELDLYMVHPLLVYQDSSPSTVGAITSGVETWIPSHIKMDDYTQMSLEWVWNEAVVRIPIINVLITQGRYLLIGIFGSIYGLFKWKQHQRSDFLSTFLSAYFGFIFAFNRLINRPQGR